MRCLNRTGEVWKFFLRDGTIQTFYPIYAINLERQDSWELTLPDGRVTIKHADWIYMQRVMTGTLAKICEQESVLPPMWNIGDFALPCRVFNLVKHWANLGVIEASCELKSPDLIMVVDWQDGKPRMHYFPK